MDSSHALIVVVVVEETEDNHHHVHRPVGQDRVLVLSHLGKQNKLHFSILKRKYTLFFIASLVSSVAGVSIRISRYVGHSGLPSSYKSFDTSTSLCDDW